MDASDAPVYPELTPETVKELWSRTYNTAGKPDWSHTFPYYHPEVVFQDSIQRVEGIEAFKALCGRLTDRCEELRMEIHSVARAGDVITSYSIHYTKLYEVGRGQREALRPGARRLRHPSPYRQGLGPLVLGAHRVEGTRRSV